MPEQANTSGHSCECVGPCFFLQFVGEALALHFRAVRRAREIVW